MLNIELNSVGFIIVYLFFYVGLIFATVPTKVGRIILSVYGVIFIAIFKIDGVSFV